MRTRPTIGLALPLLLFACAHKPLSGSDLDRVGRPAFLSRIEEDAGPRSLVFREDPAYSPKLEKHRLEPKEADRRLSTKLAKGITRFELAETLRAKTLAGLPREMPWTNVVDAAAVASALQLYLVQEVPANPPDYDLLRELGADCVVELVIEEYGMRSKEGRAGAYVVGYGRMFTLDGRRELWRRAFRADQVDAQSPHVDPFRVSKDPALFRQELSTLLEGVAVQFSKDLNPPDRRGSTSPPPLEQPAEEPPGGEQPREKPKVPEEDLPPPD